MTDNNLGSENGDQQSPSPEQPPQPDQPPQRGSMRYQDAASTAPREPTLAEQRARRQALKDREQQEIADAAVAKKADTKRKIFIGSGVTVGLVGLIATYYAVARPDNVEALCVDSNNVVQDDDFCDENNLKQQGATYNPVTGFWILPFPLGGGQYHYNYGGTGTVGGPVSGGSYQKPANANITTKSGTTVQRGGFGLGGKSTNSVKGSTGTGTGKSGGS